MSGALGRHVEHDPASRGFAVPLEQPAPLQSVRWARRSPVFDQGQVGSCTGNAAAGWLATDNAQRPGQEGLTETHAVTIYSKATHLDRVKGIYPPTDTGSSGLAACKAMVRLGLTAGPYRHAFGLGHALHALQTGPALVGMTWLTGCDTPDPSGRVHYTGTVRGGHEILADGYDADLGLVHFTNSWGPSWGKDGTFCMSVEDFGKALADHGDVTVPS